MSKEIQEIIQKLSSLAPDEKVILATVVDVKGSSYRLPGAKMLIDENGNNIGTISGGCLEADVLEQARKVLRNGQAKVLTYDTRENENSVFGLQMGCNGVVRVLLETGNENDLIKFARNCFANRRSGVVATLIDKQGASDLKIGERFFYAKGDSIDASLNDLTLRIFNKAAEVLEKKYSACHTFQTSNAALGFFFETIEPLISLFVFGAGYDALPVVETAKNLGWRVEVVDHRPAFATIERFPTADAIHVLSAENYNGNLTIDDNAATVIMTHNYERDREILKFLLNSKARYVGALGPKKRAESLLRESDENFSAERLNKLHAPVGLDIGAGTPESIAVSIVAEIQSVLANRAGGFLRDRRGSIYGR
ncbi:MAG: XdhC family protein [Pyrinomonadaceae bacterium]